MFTSRKCPRCKGDVRIDRDEYGWYEQCLMCGYLRDLQPVFETGRDNSRELQKVKRLSK